MQELGQARAGAAATVPAVGPETSLEVLEGLLGRWGLTVAHCGSKNTDRGGTRKILLLQFFGCFLFHFVLLLFWRFLLLLLLFLIIIYFYFSIFTL